MDAGMVLTRGKAQHVWERHITLPSERTWEVYFCIIFKALFVLNFQRSPCSAMDSALDF